MPLFLGLVNSKKKVDYELCSARNTALGLSRGKPPTSTLRKKKRLDDKLHVGHRLTRGGARLSIYGVTLLAGCFIQGLDSTPNPGRRPLSLSLRDYLCAPLAYPGLSRPIPASPSCHHVPCKAEQKFTVFIPIIGHGQAGDDVGLAEQLIK